MNPAAVTTAVPMEDEGAPTANRRPAHHALRLDHVSKTFGTRRVLDDVSFAVARSQAFCLLGRSGTGKSVTLRHIIGLITPDTGHVFVEGRDLSALARRELSETRKGIGFLFQGAALFDSMTVGENVAFPLRRHTRLREQEILQRARARLADVGLDREFDKMPAELSGGMQKRVGLARAMALDPSILLVDEPSAGLDPMTTREIDDLLLQRRRTGTTLVVVTHNSCHAQHPQRAPPWRRARGAPRRQDHRQRERVRPRRQR
jgi:phospholipid/cholesterol/gamma-HCH transport system ATP-binding protein